MPMMTRTAPRPFNRLVMAPDLSSFTCEPCTLAQDSRMGVALRCDGRPLVGALEGPFDRAGRPRPGDLEVAVERNSADRHRCGSGALDRAPQHLVQHGVVHPDGLLRAGERPGGDLAGVRPGGVEDRV